MKKLDKALLGVLGALGVLAVQLLGCCFAADAPRADRHTPKPDETPKLIAVLQSNASDYEKAVACQELAIVGAKEAVPALAALLPNEKLATYARCGLEAIEDASADEALRAALGKLQGPLLIGVIVSLGVRRDAKSLDALAQKLRDPDVDVAAAAAVALGRIGGAEPAKALEQFLPAAPARVLTGVAEGCILCAERFFNDGNNEAAVKLYDTIRKAEVPRQQVREAIRGAILARQTAGIPLLIEQLKSKDKELFGIGLRAARELPGAEATDALLGELAHLTPERQALLILALADRSDVATAGFGWKRRAVVITALADHADPKALPAILEVIKSGKKPAVLAALSVMPRMGNASCVPVLLKVALEDDEELARAAKEAIQKLPGQEADADIAARFAEASGKTRQILIELVAQRRIKAAVPALAPCAEDPDAGVRAAAVAAIGTLGGEKQVPDLVRILLKTQDPAERANLERALTATTARGGAACAPQLTALTKSGDAAVCVIGLHALACAGGPEALAAVKAALDDKDETVQGEAVRTLCTWPNKWPGDAGVMEPLLALAKSSKKEPYLILALRGYLQYLLGDKNLGDDVRLAKLTEAMPLAARPEEKRLVSSVLGSIPNAKALDLLLAYAADPATAEEACSAIIVLAGSKDLKDVSKEQREKALQTVLEKAKSRGTKGKAQELLKAGQ